MKNKTKNGNLRCIVPNCAESGHQDKRSMFKFPVNPVIRVKWMENIGLAKHENLYNRRVCRRHFETQCFGKAKVFSWAVPTLFLGENEVQHHCVPTIRKSFIRKCIVRNCSSRSPPDRLHFFPSDPQHRQEWLDICQLKGKDNKWLFICGRHFRRSLLPNRNSNLPKDCKPEFFLGLAEEEEDPLERGIKSEFEPLKKLCKSEDEGIDEDNFKETNAHGSCGKCQDLEEQLAAARLRIKELEEKRQNSDEEEEEEEYIIMLMK